MSNILHDVSGEHKQIVRVSRQGTPSTEDFPIFESPFKCKVTKITLKAGIDWIQRDVGNFNSVFVRDAGYSGTVASPLALSGTVLGSAAAVGTPFKANQPYTLYGGTASFNAARVLTLRLALSGTAANAEPIPASLVETTFIGD